MTGAIIAKRLVFHIGGYDPVPPEMVHRRFVRELRRFENTWSATASVSKPEIGADKASWGVITTGPNWRVETNYHFVRWDDVMETIGRRPMWRRIPLAFLAFLDFVAAGALWGYIRTNWRYAIFFLYPFLLFATLALVAWFLYVLVATASESAPIGAAAGLVVFIVLLQGPGQWLNLPQLFDDWIFSRAYVWHDNPVLERRLDRIAQEISTAALGSDADEILVVGHSLGAVLAVDLLDRALRLDPALGLSRARAALLSIGSSILKIGLHRGAKRFRTALDRVASAPGLFWAEYQALTDVMNFYKTDPITALGLKHAGRPVVRVIRFRQMLDPTAYRRIRRNFYRVHNQFVSGNDRRAAYDYFMLVCGPLSVEHQACLPEGVGSQIGEDGAIFEAPAYEGTACEGPAPLGRQ
jgi:hypothetical protein